MLLHRIKRRIASNWLGVALAGVTSLGASEAAAQSQSVAITQVKVNRDAPDGGARPVRPSTSLYSISYDDCRENVEFDFTLSVTGATDGFHAFASLSGADCTTALGRINAGAGCYDLNPSGVIPGAQPLRVYSQDLAQHLLAGVGADCNDTTSTGPNQVDIAFLVLPASGDPSADSIATYTNISIVLRGPNPPTGITLNPGNDKLLLDLPRNNDPAVLGYYVFCLPQADAATSGTSDTGGTGGAGGMGNTTGTTTPTTAAPNNCAGLAIPDLDPAHPDFDSKYICISQLKAVQTTATSTDIEQAGDGKALANDTPYVVGVSAYDSFNNLGPISVLSCGTPTETVAFSPESCNDGGADCVDGCGSCRVGSASEPPWPVLGAAALATAGLLARRQERRLRRRPRGVEG